MVKPVDSNRCVEVDVTQRLTPMMQQYLEIKAAYQDVLLFYRMGDFYELFFEDAFVAAKALSITLTKRGKHLGQDIAMCGVPVHTANDYLHKLIAAGFNVAICEQVEIAENEPRDGDKKSLKSQTPPKNKGKKLIERQVVRLVTPATLTEDSLLDSRTANYLMALAQIKEKTEASLLALAVIDISTGIFLTLPTTISTVLADIMRFAPKELIINDQLFHDSQLRPIFDSLGRIVVPQPAPLFNPAVALDRLCSYYKVATLDGFASFSPVELAANAAALAYVEKTQMAMRPPLQRPLKQLADKNLFIDPATRINLELYTTLSGSREGSLLNIMDRTLTGAGSRLLAERLMQPLTCVDTIASRHDSVAFFIHEASLCEGVRTLLQGTSDMARALSRLGVKRGGPRDLAAIARVMATSKHIFNLLHIHQLPTELHQGVTDLQNLPPALYQQLDKALADELPAHLKDGGFIAQNYHPQLDEARRLRDQSHQIIAQLSQRYAQETGIKNLKIKHNNILGFFIEVNASQASLLQEKTTNAGECPFIHRQSVANAIRFTSIELSELEERIRLAAQQALEIELQIFDTLCEQVIEHIEPLREGAAALSVIDVSAALAVLAEEQGYCRPIVDNTLNFEIVAGRHPVVECALRRQRIAPFIANDCHLSPPSTQKLGAIWLLTGPNMGGKSTFLRQNALITIMAQMGSFVPAGSAHIGVVDRLFSRVGASDDLARGRSTFMVEMVETAAILNQAGERSLVILDEIGRGTSTFDGLSIAWAALEHLHDVNHCRAIFATHFHELTTLADVLPRLYNKTMKVKEWQGDVIFLHEVNNGSADRSYGVQVAKLAGLPPTVLERAKAVLHELENGSLLGHTRHLIDDLPLFSDLLRPAPVPSQSVEQQEKSAKIIQFLSEIKPDDLTPRQALDVLYQLKNMEN